MSKKSSAGPPHGPAALRKRIRHRFEHTPVGRGWRRGYELELMHRALGFAALGTLTLAPLLIVVAATDPENGRGFAEWLSEAIGVSPASQRAVELLFAQPQRALQSTTAFGLAALAFFGLAFSSAVQTGYEKVWDLPAAHWGTMWRHVLWLALLTGYLFLSAKVTLEPEPVAASWVRLLITVSSSLLFFWWSQHLLLAGRVDWGAVLPGAVTTVLGLTGLRVFSQLVFSPLIATNAVTYGPIGTVLVIQSWLVGVGFVVFGGALVGRVLHEERPRLVRAMRRR
ncbi:YhjD/YihY/BrkB family envelope integrity protein [Streptomyces meridianus]|uniref:YihY/virulence factor BrkB family protein n=1 Tax=Streptomyces meridianus TaxID=2938945 RepID=A0ABT0XDK0_9ACTN|nr:YhjD/YihY/BrkB family envelope integrity protein [Streptomyces meridianus]MCM2579993.1 YihY/virulence factor BrkB family protein [Streptomyces meridianus]